MKVFEIRKLRFKRELYVFGHRVVSFLRLANVLEEIHRNVSWLVAYRSMRQHGVGLPADCATNWSEHYEVVKIRVGDLRRFWMGRPQPLEETALVKYLRTGDEDVIRSYYEQLHSVFGGDASGIEVSVAESCKLFSGLRDLEYDPSICCIVVNDQNIIIDGYHRSSVILAKHGPDCMVKVVRVLPDNR